jgi:hypothetical protein
MGRRKVVTTLYLTEEQMELLRRLHLKTRVPIAIYMREGVDLVLAKYGHKQREREVAS